MVDPGATQPTLAVDRAAFTGAFIAVAVGFNPLMAISPPTDHGEFGRPLFRVAYVGVLLVSVGLGRRLMDLHGRKAPPCAHRSSRPVRRANAP
jgi:hypothetical protein